MAFNALTPELFLGICNFLSVAETLSLSATRKTHHRLLMGPSADLAVWGAYARAQLQQLFSEADEVPALGLAKWNVSTYRRLCQVLHQCGHLLGQWRWEVPVRGGLLLVNLDLDEEPYSSIVAELVVPNQCSTLMVQNVTEFCSSTLFEVHFDDEECEVTVEGVTSQKGKAAMLVSGGAALGFADSLPDLPVRRAQESPLMVLREYMQAMAQAPLKFQRLRGSHGPSAPLKPGAPLGSADPLHLAGLYEGVFGPHGLEMVHVSVSADGLLQGLKVTGDPNVPAGQLCFRATGHLEPADPVCSCQHGCGCWQAARDGGRGWELAGMFRIEARTALHGFQNPQWNSGRLLVCQQTMAAPSWDCYASPDPAPVARFLIVAWDGFFSTRLSPLPC